MARCAIAVVAAVGLGLPAPLLLPAQAAGSPEAGPEAAPSTTDRERDRARQLYDRGKAKFDTTEYAEAIRLWTEAYGMLSDAPENAESKAAIIYNLATAQERAFEIDKDVTHLRRAVVLMEQYAASIPALFGDETEGATERARIDERLASVRERIEQAEAAADAAAQPATGPIPSEHPAPSPEDRPADPRARAFVISGATLVAVGVAGLGVMAGGLAMGTSANDISDIDPDDLEQRRTRFDRGRTGNILAYVGGSIGGAALVAGTVLLALGLKKRRPGTTALRIAPTLSGLQMRGRF